MCAEATAGEAGFPSPERQTIRVLLAVDGSKLSEAATRAVIAQFEPRNTEVNVLNVIENEECLDYPVGVTEDRINQAQELVDRATRELGKAGFKTEGTIYRGEARDVIIGTAEEWNTDLIVIGSHGRSDVSRFMLGSNSAAIADHAPCNVEIVRGERAKPPEGTRRAKRTDLRARKTAASVARG